MSSRSGFSAYIWSDNIHKQFVNRIKNMFLLTFTANNTCTEQSNIIRLHLYSDSVVTFYFGFFFFVFSSDNKRYGRPNVIKKLQGEV